MSIVIPRKDLSRRGNPLVITAGCGRKGINSGSKRVSSPRNDSPLYNSPTSVNSGIGLYYAYFTFSTS